MADEKYVSGEQYQNMHRASSSKGGKKVAVPANSLVLVIVAIVLCGLSFAGGMAYQKHKTKPAAAAATAASGFAGQGGGARRGGDIGQVTAVSGTSITMTSQRTNASKTYAITSSTAISDNGQTETASDIKTGDTVLITTSTSDTGTATRILVNPSFGGSGGGFGGQSAPANDNSAQTN